MKSELELLKAQKKELLDKHNDKVTRLWDLENSISKTDTKPDDKLLKEIEHLAKEIENSKSAETIKQLQEQIEQLEVELYGDYNRYSP